MVSRQPGGGAVFGSGTQGLQILTRSPPWIPCAMRELFAAGGEAATPAGGLTTKSEGILILCGEQAAQTTLPHFLSNSQYYKQIQGI